MMTRDARFAEGGLIDWTMAVPGSSYLLTEMLLTLDSRLLTKRHALSFILVLACTLGACMPSQIPAREVSEVARDMNLATRFGRMDVAAEHISEAHRRRFLETRALWGTDVRVVDIELARLDVPDSTTAEVIVDVSWVRIDEGLLRSTRVRQDWQNPGGGWQLSGEERIAGDFGLLGENVTILRPESRDTHFPTKTIR